MAKQNTTPKQSSGGGFPFETEAVALVLAHLLDRSSPFDPPGGAVERVDTQRPASEWHLDDLLVTVRASAHRHRLAFSIKSNRQISREGFPGDFIRDAWEQLLHDLSDAFDEGRDFLGLLTAPLDWDLATAIYELLRLARDQEPEDLAVQIELPQRVSALMRNLYESARCPDALAAKHGIDAATSTGRLLRRLVWIPLDFASDGSERRRQATAICRGLLRSGTEGNSRALWERLKRTADRLRRSGGGIDLPKLVDEVQREHELRDFPDHHADWERIEEDTRSAFNRVRSSIGGRVTLPRAADHKAIDSALAEQQTVVLLGSSGTGKSAVAKHQAEIFTRRGKALWLDAERLGARTLAGWRTHLGLSHPLGDVIRTQPSSEALLVLDGLDRLYDEAGFATAAEFAHAARIGDPASPWRLIITCTPEEWGRVQERLATHGMRLSGSPISITLPAQTELAAVWATFPQLAPLRTRWHLAPVLFRPKILDLLATHVTLDDDLASIGESDLGRLFWNREVAHGPNAVARADAALLLARTFADQLRADVSESAVRDEVGSVDLVAVGDLVRDRIVVRVDGRLGFEHDLYADWVRLRQLRDVGETGNLPGFLAPRLSSPVWHRALRLYGIDLLEQAPDLDPWTLAFHAVEALDEVPRALAMDILLEATAFVSRRGAGLAHPDLWQLLTADDGKLLVRLLNRLLHAATFANTDYVKAVSQTAPELAIHVAATSRLPYWPYWYGILRLLHVHREEIPTSAYGVAARATDLWLRSTLAGWPFRKEAAAIAVSLGDALLRMKEEHDSFYLDGEPDQSVYRAVLAAGVEEADRVSQIVLEAAGRRSKRFSPPPPTAEELSRRRAVRGVSMPMMPGNYGPLPDPWPYGPTFRVDGALQKTVLESDALQPLMGALPDVAREVLLALLISEPVRPRSFDALEESYGLEWVQWHPQFYTRGPFRTFLAVAEQTAVTAILQLIEHATEGWVERRSMYIARERGIPLNEVSIPNFEVEVAGQMREFVGDAQVFGWSSHGLDHGGIIGSALVALEKHLYDRADAGEDLSPLIHRLLTESRSIAIVGVLAMFARRHPQYMRGPLRGLLGSPYVLWWTMSEGFGSGWQIGASLLSGPVLEAYRQWHQMPHRRTPLRDWAITLFLNDMELRSFFDDERKRLSTTLQSGGKFEGWDFVEALTAQFDLANYTTVTDPDGNTYAQFTPPADLQRKHALKMKPMEEHLLLVTLPIELRQLVEKGEQLGSDALDRIWEKVELVRTMNADVDAEIVTPADIVVGAAAVILLLGGAWGKVHPDHVQWARAEILRVASDCPRSSSDRSTFRWDQCAFATEALPLLWAESPENDQIRGVVGRILLHGSADQAGSIASKVAEWRNLMPEDHKRLLRAVLLRAGVEARLQDLEHRSHWFLDEEERVRRADEILALREELSGVERAFVDGTLEATLPLLKEVAPLRPVPETASLRPHRRPVASRTINAAFVIAAFKGVPDPGAGGDAAWMRIWEEAVEDTFARLRQSEDELSEEPDEHEDDWERYLLQRVAAITAELPDLQAGRRLWHPVIELGASAEEWVSSFSRDWTRYALFPSAADHVVESWLAMIDAALNNPRWGAGGGVTWFAHETGKLWRALFGFTHTSAEVWSDQLRPRVRKLEPRLAVWAQDHLHNLDNVRTFARFLTYPAAADFVLRGLVSLSAAALSRGDLFWGRTGRNRDADDAILDLLAHVWGHAREGLRRDADAFAAFRRLLEALVSRQYPPALELADRVGTMPQ